MGKPPVDAESTTTQLQVAYTTRLVGKVLKLINEKKQKEEELRTSFISLTDVFHRDLKNKVKYQDVVPDVLATSMKDAINCTRKRQKES